MHDAKISDFMTLAPHTIGYDQSLATASRMMQKYTVRHIPVLDGGVIVGLVSERDIAFVEALQNFDPEQMPVEQAISQEPYVVTPDTSLQEVMKTLAEKKLGSAIIAEHGHVKGIFTATDAIQVFSDFLLTGALLRSDQPSAFREVSKRVKQDHDELRTRAARVEKLCDRASSGDVEANEALLLAARELYEQLRRHMNLEEQILVPALSSSTDGTLRVQHYLVEHQMQRTALAKSIEELAALAGDPAALAQRVQRFISELRADMDEEETLFLTDEHKP